jgi:hypothetical protein
VNHGADVPEQVFRRSSRCGGEGSCAEVAVDPASRAVLVRNSNDRQELEFDFHEWSAFVAGVKRGEFDHP